jgi:hypothetical protein
MGFEEHKLYAKYYILGIVGLIVIFTAGCIQHSHGCGPDITYGMGCNNYVQIHDAIVIQNSCGSRIKNCLKIQFLNDDGNLKIYKTV